MNIAWIEKEIAIGEIDNLLKDYDIEVDSPDGWVGVNFFVDKGMWDEYVLVTENGYEVKCNEEHLFKTTVGWMSAKEIVNFQDQHSYYLNVITDKGLSKSQVFKTSNKIPIVDINVDHVNHRYYTNGVESHNTGVGKSLFMCHCAADNLMSGLNVLYITLEMAEERIAERIDANLMNITMNELEDLPKDSYIKKMQRVKDKTTGRLIIKEYPTSSAGSANFRHLLNELRLKKNFVPDIIYIDYLNICASSRIKSGSNVNSYTLIKSIAEELRGLAVEFNVPIVSATQTTRSGYGNSDVELTDTSESFGLPATADFMFAIITSEELETLGQLMIKQLKNRYNDPSHYKRFVIGVDRSKMKLFDAEQSAQNDIMDDNPVMDKTPTGQRYEEENRSSKFDRNKFKDFK